MPLDWAKLKLINPKFDDREKFLKTIGGYVLDEIVANINLGLRPDGSTQKQNSDDYADKKFLKMKYTTPLKGMETKVKGKGGGATRQSPYLARKATFLRIFMPPDSLLIRLNDVVRASGETMDEIGKKLTDKGYWFMGVTVAAEKRIRKSMDQYVQLKLRQMAGKKYG